MVDLPRKIMVKITKHKINKIKKRDHALFVARVGILLDFADSGNVVLTLRQTLPKNLLWRLLPTYTWLRMLLDCGMIMVQTVMSVMTKTGLKIYSF